MHPIRRLYCVRKYGSGHAGYLRFRCLEYRITFQVEYAYEARNTGIKEQIIHPKQVTSLRWLTRMLS